jgi:hypothetical protein
MGITFREAIAEVELGLISGDQLPDIATSGLLEGYQSTALSALAAQFGEPFDPVQTERLWTAALQELDIPADGRTASARLLVRAYARLVAEGELAPQLGASKIAGVHRLAQYPGCDTRAPGDCIDAAGILGLFYTHHGRGYPNQADHTPIDTQIVAECRRLAQLPTV